MNTGNIQRFASLEDARAAGYFLQVDDASLPGVTAMPLEERKAWARARVATTRQDKREAKAKRKAAAASRRKNRK